MLGGTTYRGRPMKLIAGAMLVLAGSILIAGGVVAFAVLIAVPRSTFPAIVVGLMGLIVGWVGFAVLIPELRKGTVAESERDSVGLRSEG